LTTSADVPPTLTSFLSSFDPEEVVPLWQPAPPPRRMHRRIETDAPVGLLARQCHADADVEAAVVFEANNARSEWVLPSVSNPKQPISKAGIEAAWQKIRIAAKIENVRMHDLRHTVGTYAGQSGANAFLVRDLLRHKNLAMTGRYVNRADSPMRTLSDQVGERIAAAMAGRAEAQVVPLKAVKG
jgi:integrase